MGSSKQNIWIHRQGWAMETRCCWPPEADRDERLGFVRKAPFSEVPKCRFIQLGLFS